MDPTKIFSNYDITRPWISLDDWQKQYIEAEPNQNCFLLCGRQVGKTTAMSIKAIEMCIKHFKKGEYILICSITEKQAYHMLAKALAYAEEKYPNSIKKGKDKPTMHKILFKNGTGIFCYAAGERGEGLRGYTIKKLMIDEGSRMSDEFFIATMPMLSVVNGSMDIASTPCGKTGYFYKFSEDQNFKKFYISAEDCPRHPKEFLEGQKEKLSKLAYAQEYLAVFTDDLRRLFSDELIKDICTIKQMDKGVGISSKSKFYLGVDVAGYGKDECTFEVLERNNEKELIQRENLIEKGKRTTETSAKIIELDKKYSFRQIGVDDGGIGFGVFSELMDSEKTKRKTKALNNASRTIDNEGKKSKKILKEEMYLNLKALMEKKKIKLFDDEDLKESLASIQVEEEEKISGIYSHITEGLIRSAWIAEQDKSLNIFAHSF